MKNVILTHRELQANLFHAFTYGLQCQQPGPGLWITFDITEREYVWVVVSHPVKESCAVSGDKLFHHCINKGEFQMNDVRLGVTVAYLRDEAEKFMEHFRLFAEENGINLKYNNKELDPNAIYSKKELCSFGEYTSNRKGDDPNAYLNIDLEFNDWKANELKALRSV